MDQRLLWSCTERCRNTNATPELLRLGAEVTDANAAFFDAANGFRRLHRRPS